MTQKKIGAKKYISPVAVTNLTYMVLPEKAKMCSEQLSTVCGVCSHMVVRNVMNKRGGVPCTSSSCKDGHWIGASNWNRLCYV